MMKAKNIKYTVSVMAMMSSALITYGQTKSPNIIG